MTGAGRGIGLALAAALAQAGAHVVLAARTAAEIEAASAAIRADGGSAEAVVLDVTDLPVGAGGDRGAAGVRHSGEQRRHQPPAPTSWR